MAKKGNLNRGNKSLLIATQKNTLRTDYIYVKIYNTQQSNKRRERDETIYQMIIVKVM